MFLTFIIHIIDTFAYSVRLNYILNAIVTGIYTIGVMSAYYAALLVSAQHRLAVSASAGIINTAANNIFAFY